jgi:hypothetical protein
MDVIFVKCSHCKASVIPMDDNRCPNCRYNIDGSPFKEMKTQASNNIYPNCQSELDGSKKVSEGVINAMESPAGPAEGLKDVEESARAQVTQAGKRISEDRWVNAIFSGIISGVVMGISRSNLEGIIWLLPAGFTYAFCIVNGNFRFNAVQKFVATGIMLIIGMYWKEILEYLRVASQK